jgi:hypothetical protein
VRSGQGAVGDDLRDQRSGDDDRMDDDRTERKGTPHGSSCYEFIDSRQLGHRAAAKVPTLNDA